MCTRTDRSVPVHPFEVRMKSRRALVTRTQDYPGSSKVRTTRESRIRRDERIVYWKTEEDMAIFLKCELVRTKVCRRTGFMEDQEE